LKKPDRFSPADIEKKLRKQKIGRPLHFYDAIGSTNDEAMRQGEGGTPEGAVFLAESQTHGKGRLGRKWISPPGVNLYLSILLRPTFPPLQAPIVTLMAACAVREALEKVTGLKAGIKWPNDLLIGGKKVCGILTEMSAEQDLIHHMAVGIGINVNLDPDTLPPDVREKSTSLSRRLGRKVDRTELLVSLLKSMERYYGLLNRKGAKGILPEWKKHSLILRKRVRIVSQRKKHEGVIVDLSPEGALILSGDDGKIVPVYSGDVEIL
jgi:BirA family biotin operon repressor/biotin-[acetyl-CoA-carboxylase] ligase